MIIKLIVLVAIIIFIIIFYKRFNKTLPKKTDTRAPSQNYQKNSSFFTPKEQHFLITLEEAIDALPVRLYAKITLGNLIKVRSNSAHDSAQIATKQIDFILVHPHNFSPLLVIELNDQHNPVIDEIMAQIDIPILYIPPANKYSSELLKGMIMNILKMT